MNINQIIPKTYSQPILEKKIEKTKNHIEHLTGCLGTRKTHGGKNYRAKQTSLHNQIKAASQELEMLKQTARPINYSLDHKLHGHTLDQLLGTREFSLKIVQQPRFLFDMIESILKALHLVHEAGRTHGRLCPAAIVLLVKNGQPICKLRDMPLRQKTEPDTNQWRPPEGRKYCHSGDDVREFGFLLYQLLHNQLLTTAKFSQREVAWGFRPAIHCQIPKMWSDVIKACWAQEPLDRPTAESLWRKFNEWDKAADPFFWSLSIYDTQIRVNVGDPHSDRIFSFPEVPRTFTIEELKGNIARQNHRRSEVLSLYAEHDLTTELTNSERLPRNDHNLLNMVLMTKYCLVRMDHSLPLCLGLTNVPMKEMVCNIPWAKTLTVGELKKEIAKAYEFKAGMGCCLFLNGVELKDDAYPMVGSLSSNTLPSIDCVFTLGEIPLNDLRLQLATKSGAHTPFLLSLQRDCTEIMTVMQEQTKCLITGTPYQNTSKWEVTDEAVNDFLKSRKKDHTNKQILTFCQCLVQCMEQVLQRDDMHSGKDSHIFAWAVEQMLERFGYLLIRLGLMGPDREKAKEKLIKMRAKFIWMATCSFKKFAIDRKYASVRAEVTKNEKELAGLKHTRLCNYRKLSGKYAAEKYDAKAEAYMMNPPTNEEAAKPYQEVFACSNKIKKIKRDLIPLRKKLDGTPEDNGTDRKQFLRDKIESLKAKIEALKKRHERRSENLQSYGAPIGSLQRKEQEEQIQALCDQFEEKEVRLREAEEKLKDLEARDQREMNIRKEAFIAKQA